MDKKQDNNESFYNKLKTDSKYRAKVQLAGYAVIIVLIIIYLNVTNMTNNYNYGNTISDDKTNVSDNDSDTIVNNDGDLDFVNDISNNYVYDVGIVVKKKDSNGTEGTSEYNYSGKSYKDTMIINKKAGDSQIVFYKVEDDYYSKDGDNYKKVEDSLVYDLVSDDYIELDNLKKFISLASLDHYTNYSSGKKEYVYNLKLSDVILNYKEDTSVDFNIVVENNIVTVDVDYTNIIKLDDDIENYKSIDSCIIKYTYSEIGKVEEIKLDGNLVEND